MSKKKTSCGSTMTLKDFHGGSIPSDLSLPSAPGLVARPADRIGLDRHASWANPTSRTDHRLLRPGLSSTVKKNDNKNPFLSHTVRIGRNFDEDERKPLDGSSAPRPTVSDESIYAPANNRLEIKPDSYSLMFSEVTNISSNSGRHVSNPSSPLSSMTVIPYPQNSSETLQAGVSCPKSDGNSSSMISGAQTNVWAARKEVLSSTGSLTFLCNGPTALSKMEHASALDKVSSGRWQSKQPIHQQTEVEVIGHSIESGLRFKGKIHHGMGGGIAGEQFHLKLSKDVDETLVIEDDRRCGGSGYNRSTSLVQLERGDTNPSANFSGVPLIGSDMKFGGSGLEPSVTSDVTDRPKLKLLPKSRPSECAEVGTTVDYKQHTGSDHLEAVTKSYPNTSVSSLGLSDIESKNPLPERPKLNLKPRSQPLELFKESIVKERNPLFGGARPRELVLKERGIDDVENRWNKNESEEKETWRKPSHSSSSSSSSRHGGGKVASAVELAHAFSKSTPSVGIASEPQLPFSRLLSQGGTTRRINGY